MSTVAMLPIEKFYSSPNPMFPVITYNFRLRSRSLSEFPPFVLVVSLVFMLVLVASTNLNAQTQVTQHVWKLESGDSPGKAAIEDVKWLSGDWEGVALGGTVDETWSIPRNGHMSGMFRVFQDGKLAFSEYFTISEKEKSLVLTLRHFHPGLVAWEDKDNPKTFKLISVETKDGIVTAKFDGLTYRLQADGSLQAFVPMKGRDGTLKEVSIPVKRMEK